MTSAASGGFDRDRRTIAVVAAGLSQPSSTTQLAERLADAADEYLTESGLTVRRAVIELRPHAKDLAEALVAGQPSDEVAGIVAQVTGADGLIAVTPTFAASYAGLFKSFFDVLDPDALTGMPVLLGATGGSARHSLVIEYALRPLLNYFRARIVPTGVFAAAEDFASGPAAARLDARIRRAGRELAGLVADGRRSAAQPADTEQIADTAPPAGTARPAGTDEIADTARPADTDEIADAAPAADTERHHVAGAAR